MQKNGGMQIPKTKKAPFDQNGKIPQLSKNAMNSHASESDSSPQKRQSDKSYLSNQAMRTRLRTLSANAPFCASTVIGNLNRNEY